MYDDEYVGKLLKRFNKIVVREEEAQNWVWKLADKEADLVCGPTMLLTVDEWEQVVHPVNYTEEYVLVYFDSPGGKCLQGAINYAEKKNLKVFYINYGLHENMKLEVNKLFNVNNSLVLNNGIDVSRYINVTPKDKMKKKFNIQKNSFVIGHIGRFNKVKNHSFIADVFYEIYKNNNKAFLLLVGTGKKKITIINKLDSLGLSNNYLILEN